MNIDTYYTDHWKHIEEDRMARYERMFEWREDRGALLVPAVIGPGHRVLDFGSGPGFMALAIADIVGETGHVHGVDLNAGFVNNASTRAAGRTNVSFHQVTGREIPLADGAVDRVVCKNVLEYVPDLDATLSELRRVLASGGRIHIMDSDWGFVIVEPWGKENVDRYFGAASIAFREPHIGRKAPRVARAARLCGCRRAHLGFRGHRRALPFDDSQHAQLHRRRALGGRRRRGRTDGRGGRWARRQRGERGRGGDVPLLAAAVPGHREQGGLTRARSPVPAP